MQRFLLVLLTFSIAWSAAPGDARIALWKGDAEAAFVITLDDWKTNHYQYADTFFANRGLVATFGVVTNGITQSDGITPKTDQTAHLRRVAGLGHEIASHSLTHGWLTQLTAEQVQYLPRQYSIYPVFTPELI